MIRAEDFYGSGAGDRLIDTQNFPAEINVFLMGEQAILNAVAPSFDLLVEVGCMQGRYLDWAVDHGKYYLGLDVVPKYIAEGQRAVSARGLTPGGYRFVLGGAEEIERHVHPELFGASNERSLLFFPFNSFGNARDVALIIASLKRAGLPFLVSSYDMTARATTVREQYYRRCGYINIQVIEDERCVCFSSEDGLRTIAYSPTFLQRLAEVNRLPMMAVLFAEIGMAYASPGVATSFTGKLLP